MTIKHSHKFALWRYLVNFWAVILYFMVILDFATDNAFKSMLGPLAAIYIGALAIYAGDKELERWQDLNGFNRHPGEIFVVVWTLLILLIIFMDLIYPRQYEMPGEVTSVYIAVLTILAITRKSKTLYKKKRGA